MPPLTGEGRIEAIFVYPKKQGPALSVESAVARRGRGIEGDHWRHPSRQVTLLSSAAWADALREVGAELPLEARRANVVVSGLVLRDSAGQRIRLGGAVLEIGGETTPCELMDATRAGLRKALETEWRGGVFARVVEEGQVAVGDAVKACS